MLTWRVCCRARLRPRGWRGTWSDFSTEHLFTTYPSSFLIDCVEPWSYNLLSQFHVPNADQMLVESLIPHETPTMVRSVRDSSKKACWRLRHYLAILIHKSIPIHVSNTSQHVSKRILSSLSSWFCPIFHRICLNTILAAYNSFWIDKSRLESSIKGLICLFNLLFDQIHIHLFGWPSLVSVFEVKINRERQFVESLNCN